MSQAVDLIGFVTDFYSYNHPIYIG